MGNGELVIGNGELVIGNGEWVINGEREKTVVPLSPCPPVPLSPPPS
jgi:hypothetical protein